MISTFSPARARLLWAVLVCCVVAGVVGCSSSDRPASSESSPSAASQDEALAKSRLLEPEDLESDWRRSDPPGGDFRSFVCGVDMEPDDIRGSARRRVTVSEIGPFVAQYVQVNREGLPEQIVGQLRAALPDCERFDSSGGGEAGEETWFAIDHSVAFEGEPPEAVVWRMRPEEGSVLQDVAVIADGDLLIWLVSYTIGTELDPATIVTAAEAVLAKR